MNESLEAVSRMESSTVHHNQHFNHMHFNHMQNLDSLPAVSGAVQSLIHLPLALIKADCLSCDIHVALRPTDESRHAKFK